MQLTLAERQAMEEGAIMKMGFYVASVRKTGEIVYNTPNMREGISYPEGISKEGRQDTFLRTENGYREAIHRGPGPNYSVLVIGAPTEMIYTGLAALRWQLRDSFAELVRSAGQTYAFTKGWGVDTEEGIKNMIKTFPQAGVTVRRSAEPGDQ